MTWLKHKDTDFWVNVSNADSITIIKRRKYIWTIITYVVMVDLNNMGEFTTKSKAKKYIGGYLYG